MGEPFPWTEYRAAFEAKDVARCLPFYAEDAEWVEYRHTDPPRSPNVMRGHEEIGAFLGRVAEMELTLELGNEVLGGDRIAFACTVTFREGDKIIEHVIADVSEGRIVRQVEVEAWD